MPPFNGTIYPLRQDSSWKQAPSATNSSVQDELDPSAIFIEAEVLARLHRQTTNRSLPQQHEFSETHTEFKSFIQENDPHGWYPVHQGVCFENLTTMGKRAVDQRTKTLKTALWRTFTCQDIYEWTIQRWIKSAGKSYGRALISGFSGTVRKGEMMLVLGRPGSGCSTFLRTIANDHSSFLSVDGFLSYSGLSADEVRRSHRGEVSYVPEDDVHFPTLTVRQTLNFVLQSKVPKRYHHDIPGYLEMYGKVFGMSHVLDTLVGNEYIRGISGGERKRVSIMESLAIDSAVIAWDNSTRGLDASSAVKYAQSLRILTDVTGKATIVTLYQASDAIVKLMDKIMLIDDGKMIFQGPAWEAVKYFEDIGYHRDERQTVADFLTSVTSPTQRKFRDGWEHQAPKTATEFESIFRKSSFYHQIVHDIAKFREDTAQNDKEKQHTCNKMGNPFTATASVKKSKYVSSSSSFNTSFPLQIRICIQREWWQLKQHMFPLYIRFGIVIISALLLGSMFYNQPLTTDGVYSRGGFIFYAAVTIGWIQLAELEGAMEGRAIIARHKNQAMVRPSVVGLAKVVFDLGIILVETILFCLIAYFMGGLRREAGPFFIFTLFIYIEAVCFTAIYRLFASFSPNFELALRYCGVMLLACILFGGYLYPSTRLLQDVPWVGWITYVVPVSYGFEGILVTELNGLSFDCGAMSLVPRGDQYDGSNQTCSFPGSQVGQSFIEGAHYLSSYYDFVPENVWRNFGILVGMFLAYTIISLSLVEFFDWNERIAGASGIERAGKASPQKVVSDEENQVPSTSGNLAETTEKKLDLPILESAETVFTWSNIHYKIPLGDSERILLNNVSGYCKPGEMTALVGASGAGKSTLLTVLSQRFKVGTVTGDLTLNSTTIGSSFTREIGFCPQLDIHDDTSTVREAFIFSALMRQDARIHTSEKIEYANKILRVLGLADLHDALIGSLSLEAKRRTSIGVELCAKPKLLLFLDEPTSGLDSEGAMNIVMLLRKLADEGQAILCTIHQASHQQIEVFDRILALQPGGTTFYNGPVGSGGQAIFQYFGQHGFHAEPGKNAADFIIEVGTGAIKSSLSENIDWSTIWKQSAEARSVDSYIKQLQSKKNIGEQPATTSGSGFSATTYNQIFFLTIRNLRQFYRSSEYTYARLYACFVHAIFNGLVFFQLDDSSFSLQAAAYAVFMVLMLVPEFVNGISFRFIANRNIWLEKELPCGTYNWVAFASAQILAELPFAVAGAIIFYLLFYFMVGLPLGLPSGYVFLMNLFFHLFATSWGQWIAALSPDALTAANLMPLFVVMCELFNGILQPVYQMPVFWRYTMYYVTPFTYWIGGTLASVLSNRSVVCSAEELIYFPLPSDDGTCASYAQSFIESNSGYLFNQGASGSGTLCGYCQYDKGEDFLSTYRLSGSTMWRDFGIFLAFVMSNYALVYLLVYWNSPQRKKFTSIFKFNH